MTFDNPTPTPSPDQVKEIVDLIKGASPTLWQAAQQQVQTQIRIDAFVGVTFAILGVIGLLMLTSAIIGAIVRDWESGAFFIGAAGVILFGLGVGIAIYNLSSAWQMANAPTYAALQVLASLIQPSS